ncbi:MAG: D-glucuronyl C5-epimerase domain protein [Thermoleophilia bacterium]|nr:D-glucuronyl C5-epimerase domain protein [Thermoleophilia bacterium]
MTQHEPNPGQDPVLPRNDDARHQPMGDFAPGAVMSGYHMDLRGVAGSYGTPEEAEAWLDLLVARREYSMPVSILQLGLGAWQRSVDPQDPDRAGWSRLARLVADWAAVDMDGHGRFTHHQPMPHTYAIAGGWHSAMAQGLGASLLSRHDLPADAERATDSLIHAKHGLISCGKHGPILEEYPAEPRPHVLNGWIWALFGLYDVAHSPDEYLDVDFRAEAAAAYAAGVASLVGDLAEYETGRGWSTYDRYPHPIANVASPFYHRLHVDMLRALARIAPEGEQVDELLATSDRWEAALARPMTRATAVARKVGFRIVKPRRKAA